MLTLVESSLLSSIEYSSDHTLDLRFRSGVTYRYFAVPQTVVEGFIAAESKGTYFNRHVRDRFPYQRL
jgi:KTSC domain